MWVGLDGEGFLHAPFTASVVVDSLKELFNCLLVSAFLQLSFPLHRALHFRDAPSRPFTVSTRLAYQVRQPQEMLVLYHSYTNHTEQNRSLGAVHLNDLDLHQVELRVPVRAVARLAPGF